MKKISLPILATVSLLLLTASCQRNSSDLLVAKQEKPVTISDQAVVLAKKSAPQSSCNPFAYTITLESKTFIDGNWEWLWSVQNPNPGNGNNGTVQNLSHWGMQFGSCVNLASIVSAAYSADGTNWSEFTPAYQSDPSQGCMTLPVLKFNFGTSGATKSFYRLVVNQDYTAGIVQGYYKSGINTGCCTFDLTGISGCGGPIEIEVVE